MIRVIVPSQLGVLSNAPREVELDIPAPVTANRVIDALESAYPDLRGMLRDPTTRIRRPMIRYFVAEEDVSHLDPDTELPTMLADGKEPFWIVAAISGG